MSLRESKEPKLLDPAGKEGGPLPESRAIDADISVASVELDEWRRVKE
jgi:hypothetical protein